MPTLTIDAQICILDLGPDENRLAPDDVAELCSALDEVVATAEPAALVTTGTGKFFSNGLDTDWLERHPDRTRECIDAVQGLLARILTLPVPSVAAVNGHAFGAGAMIALAHDHRLMRSDRGYFCFPEVDVKIPFTAGMAALIQARTSPRVALEAMTTGRRYTAEEAVSAGLVDAHAPSADLVSEATRRVAGLVGKDRATLGAIKSVMFADVVERLLDHPR